MHTCDVERSYNGRTVVVPRVPDAVDGSEVDEPIRVELPRDDGSNVRRRRRLPQRLYRRERC